MRSLQIRNSYILLITENLWQHWENIIVDNRVGDNLTDVHLERPIAVWVKQAVSQRMRLLVVEDSVCEMKGGGGGGAGVCWVSHAISHQPAPVTYLENWPTFS
jgi:hypothetical protein